MAALLVVGTGLAVAAWGLQAGDRESVLAVGQPIAKGQIVEQADLVSTSVAGFDAAIPVAQVGSVVGQTASVDLVQGQVLTAAMLTSAPVPSAGEAVIGLALDPTRVPGSGLNPGDTVDVVAVPGSDDAQADSAAFDTPEVITTAAQVYDVTGRSTAGAQIVVTLVVPADDAARIAAYSTQNRVAVIETAPPSADPSGADRSGADPSGADPTGADPSDADPSDADPSDADPSDADPSSALPSGAAETQPSQTAPADANQTSGGS